MKRRERGGYVLLVVLVLIMVMALAVAGFYARTELDRTTSVVVNAQQLALARAEQGAQDAIQGLRSGRIVAFALTPNAAPPNAADCAVPTPANCSPCVNNCLEFVLDNGQARELTRGGGLQYEWVIFRPPGGAADAYVIRSNGFFGYTRNANNLTTAGIEVEFTLSEGTGDYRSTQYGDNSGAL